MTPWPRSLLSFAAVLAVLLGWSCAVGVGGGGRSSGSGPERAALGDGIQALETGEYQEATGRLGWLASRCESGVLGRRALLLLATAALDPRNPDASPDRGAWLAAHVLGLPGAEPEDRLVAEALYLLSVELGGRVPTAEGGGGSSGGDAEEGLAPRFQDCRATDAEGGAPTPQLPTLPGSPMALLYTQVRAERDSLQARVTELEAELERIREILNGDLPEDEGDGRP
jgi:hypothetical protein